MDIKAFPTQEQVKFISASLLEIINSQEMMREEIIGTLKLWSKTGWTKESSNGTGKDGV